jgi:hypothetical protein
MLDLYIPLPLFQSYSVVRVDSDIIIKYVIVWNRFLALTALFTKEAVMVNKKRSQISVQVKLSKTGHLAMSAALVACAIQVGSSMETLPLW